MVVRKRGLKNLKRYNYVCNAYSTSVLVDCFGGSGFLSLLAHSKDSYHYETNLRDTHELYEKIKLTQLYYKKVMK